MLSIISGTDRIAVRKVAHDTLSKTGLEVVRITDTHTVDDLRSALAGPGMFDTVYRAVLLEHVFGNDAMRTHLETHHNEIDRLPFPVIVIEDKIDAATKRLFQPYLRSQHDLPKKSERSSQIFAIGDAIKKRDRKAAWIAYHQALLDGSAPEAIHGLIFWAAKDMFLKARSETDRSRAHTLLRSLVALPHEARRKGEDLQFTLEQFILSDVVS